MTDSTPTVATYETRPATVWDLLAVHHRFIRGGAVESHWHTGPEAGRVATWQVHGSRESDTGHDEIVLAEHADGSGETMEIDFDYYDDPDKAARHLVHADLRGVTFRQIDHTADTYRLIDRATYRLTDDSPRYPYYSEFTGEELYVQDPRTFTDLAATLTTLGFGARMRDVDMGAYVCLLSAGDTATSGYHLVAAWAGGPSVPQHWMLIPVTQDPTYGVYESDEENFTYIDLGLPMHADVDTVAMAAAEWLTANAPHLRSA